MRRVYPRGVQDSLHQLRHQSGIHRDSDAQNGISERDGRTLATMTRCLLKDGNFPRNMWGELFFTAVRLSNRAQHWEEHHPS